MLKAPETQWVVVAEGEHMTGRWTFDDFEAADRKIQSLEANGYRGHLYEMRPIPAFRFGVPDPKPSEAADATPV